LIEAGDQKLLIDVGRGATIRLYQLHIPLSKVDVVFFTHYHSASLASARLSSVQVKGAQSEMILPSRASHPCTVTHRSPLALNSRR
jgi:ribonuclease BN (tRNA processing enzyme)